MQHLRGVVRVRTRLSHRPSVGSRFPAMIENREPSVGIARLRQSNGQSKRTIPVMLLVTLLGCGPRAHIPVRPIFLQGALAQTDSGAILARSLAPVLYLQRDERFPLSRPVLVIHPSRRPIAYHLLCAHHVNGSGLPFTVATDQDIVGVRCDR